MMVNQTLRESTDVELAKALQAGNAIYKFRIRIDPSKDELLALWGGWRLMPSSCNQIAGWSPSGT